MIKDNRTKSVIFYFEAGQEKGLGKLYRCRSLALELSKDNNIDITISTAQKELYNFGFSGLRYNWLSSKKILESYSYDIFVLDLSDCPIKLQKEIKQRCNFLVGIDDWGMGPFVYDVVLRPNILKLPPPKMLENGAKVYQGGEFILLNPEYSDLRITDKEKDVAENIFLCFGGSDPNDYTIRVSKILLKMTLSENMKFTVVLGPAFTQADKINVLLGNKANFKIFQNPVNMIELYNSCDTAIISGGNLLYEACALGIPSIALAQEQEQHEETKLFSKRKAAIRPKDGMRADDQSIMKSIKELLWNSEIRSELIINSQKCVSRSGTKLVAETIIKNYREKLETKK